MWSSAGLDIRAPAILDFNYCSSKLFKLIHTMYVFW